MCRSPKPISTGRHAKAKPGRVPPKHGRAGGASAGGAPSSLDPTPSFHPPGMKFLTVFTHFFLPIPLSLPAWPLAPGLFFKTYRSSFFVAQTVISLSGENNISFQLYSLSTYYELSAGDAIVNKDTEIPALEKLPIQLRKTDGKRKEENVGDGRRCSVRGRITNHGNG